MTLTPELGAAFARAALANVTREYPRKLDHLLNGPHGDLTPHAVHPAFYGSYDWHSAVHMHWLLLRVLRTHPGLPEAAAIVRVLDAHLSSTAIAVERAYFEVPGRRTFERPYGWAWLLELQAEVLRLAEDRAEARRWAEALQPLAAYLADRMRAFLAEATYPIRSGMHPSTAFACVLALDYARVAGDGVLAAGIESAARRWHLADRDAPLAYEPSLADFLSPALTEAQLMRAVLPDAEFGPWLAVFLPNGLGPLAIPPAFPTAPTHNSPTSTGGDYVGEHWLASFAALALGEAP